MKHLVEALDTYEKNNIRDSQLQRIPKKGEHFEVNNKRLKVLLGENEYNLIFVKEVAEKKEYQRQKVGGKNDDIENI